MRNKPQRLRQHKWMWDELFQLLRTKVRRAVFFMGGYADKFSTCGPVYDENLGIIREWMLEAGFELQTRFEEVAAMSLGDPEHWAVCELGKLANMWHQMLFGEDWKGGSGGVAVLAAPVLAPEAPAGCGRTFSNASRKEWSSSSS
eukprot:g24977.t1